MVSLKIVLVFINVESLGMKWNVSVSTLDSFNKKTVPVLSVHLSLHTA